MDEDEDGAEGSQPRAQTLDPVVAARLEGRYGGGRRRRRGLVIAVVTAVALVLGGVGVVIMSGVLTPAKNVSGEAVNTMPGARSTAMDWQLSAPTGHAIRCALDAQDVDHIMVGWVVVDVPASADPNRRLHTVIRTTRPAVTAEVSSCWLR